MARATCIPFRGHTRFSVSLYLTRNHVASIDTARNRTMSSRFITRPWFLLGLAAAVASWGGCGSKASDASSEQEAAGDGGASAGGDCTSTYPVSQGPSEPCCLDWGGDACGAGLFCAALDGRMQATCYANNSRTGGQGCTGNVDCVSNACDSNGVCSPGPGEPCMTGQACGPGVGTTTPAFCEGVCATCEERSDDPVCSSLACFDTGEHCYGDADCCQGSCDDTVGWCCVSTGGACTNDSDCCGEGSCSAEGTCD